MQIDWTHFTPWLSLSGGLMLGLAATAFLLFGGRILGVSGIVGGLFAPRTGDLQWRLVFVLGLAASPALFFAAMPAGWVHPPRVDAQPALIVLAGLLVGVGSRLGSGCTSGHGICGLSRRSPRSMVATASFMAAGFLTVFVIRHLL